ncbi:MAG: hypothetical protein ACKO1K_02775 [Burkholderiales bacterium]
MTAVPLPLETQTRDHKVQLRARIASLQKINDRGGRINEEVATAYDKTLRIDIGSSDQA